MQLCPNHFEETYDPTTEDPSRERKSWKGRYKWRMKNGFGLGYREQVVVDGTIMHGGGSGPRQGKKSTTAIRESQRIRDGEGFMLVNSFNCASIFPPTRKIRTRLEVPVYLDKKERLLSPEPKRQEFHKHSLAHDIIPFFSCKSRERAGPPLRRLQKILPKSQPTDGDTSNPDSVKRFIRGKSSNAPRQKSTASGSGVS
ncbi:MAG: hypothetical protein LQ344_007356 [Seirophora lacunosa]|nr:MAG: hypothetical protein LQ344_007356 [Seirophora lacunosa]